MMTFRWLLLGATATLGACATPEPNMISPGVYMVSRTSAAGSVFVNMAQLKADTIEAANRFAAARGKVAVVVSMRDERPVPGFPLVEYQFRLVEPGAVKDSEIVLRKNPDAVIQRNDTMTIKSDVIPQKEQPKELYVELLKLEDLRKRGLLTEEEFQSEKKKLLSGR